MLRICLLIAILILSACRTTNDVGTTYEEIIREQKASCTYGGELRLHVLNNMRYADKIRSDADTCILSIKHTEAYSANPVQMRTDCMIFAHQLNGGISPLDSYLDDQHVIPAIMDNIEYCGGK